MTPEAYIVTLGDVKGRRVAKRHRMTVPLDAATGNFHRLADRTLNDLIKDLRHEQRRRAGELFDGQEAQRTNHPQLVPVRHGVFDPASTQVTDEDEDDTPTS